MKKKQRVELNAFKVCAVCINSVMPSFLPIIDADNVPILDLGDRRGATGYIDFLRAEEMTHPIMRGVDVYHRPFVAIKAQTKGECRFREVVGVFFQRYTNDSSEWAYGTCYPLNMIYHSSRVREEHMEGLAIRLNTLFEGGEIRNVDFGLSHNEDWINGNGPIVLFTKQSTDPQEIELSNLN